jgi:hypothetical protein
MDQVSRPLLIVLASTIVLAALWLVALRPKAPDVADTPAAPVTAIAKAKDASAASDAANAKVQAGIDRSEGATPAQGAAAPAQSAAASGQTAATPAGSAAATPATNGKRDAAIVREVGAGKVVVMLFWNAKGADDIATRGALRGVSSHGGRVAVHVVPIADVGRYPAITQGVTIAQTPTTLVIGRKRKTRVIAGLSEPHELTQAVGDALAGR